MALEPDTVRLGLGAGFVVVVAPFRFGRGPAGVNFGLDDPSFSMSEPSSASGLLARFFLGFGVGLEEDRVFVLERVVEEVALRFLLGAGESER